MGFWDWLKKPFEWMGKQLGATVEYGTEYIFGELIENRDKTERMQTRVNDETVKHSIDKDMFQTKKGKEAWEQVKENKAKEGTSVIDWADGFLAPFVGKSTPEVLMEEAGVPKEDLPEIGKNVVDLMGLNADLATLTGYIDIVGDLSNFAHIKHVGRMVDRIMNNSGLGMMTGYGMGTAFGEAMTPPIKYSINEKRTPKVPAAPDLREFQVKEVYKGLDETSIEEVSKEAQKHVGEPKVWPEMKTWRGKQLVPYPPERYFKNMRKNGYDRGWAEDMWAAHWEEPSYRRAREMLGRLGPDVLEGTWQNYKDITPVDNPSKEDVMNYVSFDSEDMDRLMRFRDINPYWRSKLEAIAYRPYTRVDVRRMYERGVFREEIEDIDKEIERMSEQDPQFDTMFRAFREQRYPKRKALNMAKFYIRWANREIIDNERDTILQHFKRNEISEEAARTNLNRLLDRPELTDSLISKAKTEGPEGTPTKKELKQFLNMKDGLSEPEVRQYLEWDGYEGKIIDLYIKTWKGGAS